MQVDAEVRTGTSVVAESENGESVNLKRLFKYTLVKKEHIHVGFFQVLLTLFHRVFIISTAGFFLLLFFYTSTRKKV